MRDDSRRTTSAYLVSLSAIPAALSTTAKSRRNSLSVGVRSRHPEGCAISRFLGDWSSASMRELLVRHREEGHDALQRFRLGRELLGCRRQLLGGGRRALGDLIHGSHRLVHLLDPARLLLTGGGDFLYESGSLLICGYALGKQLARRLRHGAAVSCVCRSLAAFCVMDADICSRLAVVSSTEAACSLVPWDRLAAVDDTCDDAPDNACAPERTSRMIREISSANPLNWSAISPSSSREVTARRPVRSPAAKRFRFVDVATMGRASLRESTREIAIASTSTASVTMMVNTCARCSPRSADSTAATFSTPESRTISSMMPTSSARAAMY